MREMETSRKRQTREIHTLQREIQTSRNRQKCTKKRPTKETYLHMLAICFAYAERGGAKSRSDRLSVFRQVSEAYAKLKLKEAIFNPKETWKRDLRLNSICTARGRARDVWCSVRCNVCCSVRCSGCCSVCCSVCCNVCFSVVAQVYVSHHERDVWCSVCCSVWCSVCCNVCFSVCCCSSVCKSSRNRRAVQYVLQCVLQRVLQCVLLLIVCCW